MVGVAEDVVQRLNSLSHLCQQVNVACPAEFLAIHQVAMAWRKKITLGLQVYVWWFRVCLVESLGRIGERQQQGKLRSFSHQQEGRASPARQYPSGSHAIPDQNAPLHQLEVSLAVLSLTFSCCAVSRRAVAYHLLLRCLSRCYLSVVSHAVVSRCYLDSLGSCTLLMVLQALPPVFL